MKTPIMSPQDISRAREKMVADRVQGGKHSRGHQRKKGRKKK